MKPSARWVRVIPCLLLRGNGLWKSVRFGDHRYVGDPVNVVRVFNEKEADELIFLDTTSTRENRGPNLAMLRKISGECFMPLAYGGGLHKVEHVEQVLRCGVEKVIFNTALVEHPDVVRAATAMHAGSTVVASLDFRVDPHGRRTVFVRAGTRDTGIELADMARRAEDLGVGEILVNSIDRDGTMKGYDFEALASAARAVSVPVIACGGAGSLGDFRRALHECGVSAVAAGSFFVFWGRYRAVLITYPETEKLRREVFETLPEAPPATPS